MQTFVEELAALEGAPPSFSDELAALEQADRQEFEEKEAAKPYLLRKAGEAGRGLWRGVEDIAIGGSDLTGDAISWATDGRTRGGRWPEWLPDNPVFPPGTEVFPGREDVVSKVPHSSGSGLEKAGRFVGNMAFPGGGPAKTVLGATGKALGWGGLYGAITSEKEGSDRLVDAVQSGLTAGLLGGTLHSGTRGFGKESIEAKRLEQAIDQKLGDKRISDRIPLAQRLGDDRGSRLLARTARARNKNVRGAEAQDMARRVNDDVYQIRLQESFREGPLRNARETFRRTRDPLKAFQAGAKEEKRLDKADLRGYYATIQREKDRAAEELLDHQEANKKLILRKTRQLKQEKRDYDNAARKIKDELQAAGTLPTKGPRLRLHNAKAKEDKAKKFQRWDDELQAITDKQKKSEQTLKAQQADRLGEVEMDAMMEIDQANLIPMIQSRQLLKESIESQSKKGQPSGRFSSRTLRSAGDHDTADLMVPLKKEQGERFTKKPKGVQADTTTILGELAGGASLAASGHPVGQVVGGAVLGKALGQTKRRLDARAVRKTKERAEFQPDVSRLPAFKKEKAWVKALYGEARYQKELRALRDLGYPVDEAEEMLMQAARAQYANQREEE